MERRHGVDAPAWHVYNTVAFAVAGCIVPLTLLVCKRISVMYGIVQGGNRVVPLASPFERLLRSESPGVQPQRGAARISRDREIISRLEVSRREWTLLSLLTEFEIAPNTQKVK